MKRFVILAMLLAGFTSLLAQREAIDVRSKGPMYDTVILVNAKAVASTPEAARSQALSAALFQSFAFKDAVLVTQMLEADKAVLQEVYPSLQMMQVTEKQSDGSFSSEVTIRGLKKNNLKTQRKE